MQNFPGKGRSPSEISSMLMDEERKANMEELNRKRERTSKLALAIEKILIDEDANWDEWGAVIDVINARSQVVIPRLTIKEINQRYESISGTKASSDAIPSPRADGGGEKEVSGSERKGD